MLLTFGSFQTLFCSLFCSWDQGPQTRRAEGGGHVLLTCCCRLSFLRRPWVVRLQNRGRLPKLQVRIRSPNRPKSHFRGFNFQNFLQEYHAELFRKLAPSAIDNSPPLNLYYAKSGNSVETLTKQPIGTIIKILDL